MKKSITMALVLSAMMTYAQEGKVGINTESPATTLHVKNKNAADEPLRLENLQTAKTTEKNAVLLTNEEGTVRKSANYNRSLLLRLPENKVVLNEVGAGAQRDFSGMRKVGDDIDGVTFASNTLTLSEGLYILNFTYSAFKNEGVANPTKPNAISDSKCTVSSYFIDFPKSGASSATATTRIHSNQVHNPGDTAGTNDQKSMESTIHGGTINYVLEVPAGTTKSMKMHLGRGVGGNCEYNTWWQQGGDNSAQRKGGATFVEGTSFTVTKVR